jgi:hypothetical protein
MKKVLPPTYVLLAAADQGVPRGITDGALCGATAVHVLGDSQSVSMESIPYPACLRRGSSSHREAWESTRS